VFPEKVDLKEEANRPKERVTFTIKRGKDLL
jgi:hypothetical protein